METRIKNLFVCRGGDSRAAGVLPALLLASAVSALADVHYVNVNSTNATPPYTNWTTAATHIQDAVDAAVAGDEVVVTNGIYTNSSCSVTVNKALNVRSVNGPNSTTIYGGWGFETCGRCVTLTNDASLSGFTLTHGIVTMAGFSAGGAGAYGGGTLNNCLLTGNTAEILGGGALACTLNNCTLTGNTAGGGGGGAYDCTLNNCTLTGNTGGGAAAAACTLNNCIVYFNSGGNYNFSSALNYCCTTPLPPSGVSNITNVPLFVDTNGWSNLRLQANSPCINAGNNSYATNATDLDGNPRISGGTVDIGAYEFQWPQLTIAPSGTNVLLSWPTNNAGYDYTGFTLQSTTNLVSPAVWVTNSRAPVVADGQNTATNLITGAQKFYRLVQ